MKDKFTSSIAGASIFISISGVISKGIGFFREMLFASLFGLSVEFDVYLVSAVLPLTINIILFYLGQNYLIPTYNKLKEKDPNFPDSFIQTNFYLFILGGLFISLILYLFSDFIVSIYLQNNDPTIRNTARNVFEIFLITIPINCAVSVLSAFQNIHFEFKYPSISILLFNVAILIFVFWGYESMNIYAIPSGYLVGMIFQFLYLSVKVKKTGFHFSYRLPSIKKIKEHSLTTPLIIIIIIESIGQLYAIADRYFYNQVPSGGIAALNYAQILFALPISIITMAISTAIFPRFSQYINKNLINELEKIFNRSIVTNITIFVPVTILFLYYGDYFVKIFFERGKFLAGDTIVTSQVLVFFSLSLVFYAIYGIINKMLYGLGLVKYLLLITIFGIIIKIVANFLFVDQLEENGLALSTSISYLFFFFSGMMIIYRHLDFRNKMVFFNEIVFHLGNGLVSLIIVKQLLFLFEGIILLEIALFVVLYSANIIVVKHSSLQIFNMIIYSFKGNKISD